MKWDLSSDWKKRDTVRIVSVHWFSYNFDEYNRLDNKDHRVGLGISILGLSFALFF